jgi:hypothetical protein
MALPFRSIFGLTEPQQGTSGSSLATENQDRGSWLAATDDVASDGVYTIDAESLSAAIPEELRSGAATHSSRVTLQLDGAALRPDAGEVTTMLAQIYRACPQLFTVAIDEGLDMPVTLRLAGGEVGGSGAPVPPPLPAFGQIGAGEGENPFRPKASGNPFADSAFNPFVSPLVKPMELPSCPPPLPPTGAGGVAEVSADAGTSVSLLSPFLAAITGAAAPAVALDVPPLSQASALPAFLVQVPTSALPAVALPSLPSSVAVMETAEPEIPEMKLSFPFHSLLAQVDPSALGVNPSALPHDWKTHLPLSFVKPQFMGGRVVATLTKLIEHADAAAKVGLQGINGTIEVNIPLKEIVRQLPPSELVPSSPFAVVSEKPSLMSEVNPFLSQAQEEARRGYVPLKEAPPVRMDPTAPVISPFRIAPVEKPAAVATQSTPGEVFAAPVIKPAKPLDSLDELNGELLPKTALISVPAAPAPAAMVPTPPVAGPWSAPVSASTLAQGTEPSAAAASSVSPQAAPAESSWLRFDGVGFQPSVRDLELRAVFGRSETFTRQLAVELTAGMPGVAGCVLFAATGGVPVLAQSIVAQPEAGALLARTPRMFERIRGLAEDLGFDSGETFTLRTSQGVVSFFSQGGVCLSVLQEGERTDAGFWEKLILVACGMAALRE